ncbi:MAG: transketolase family protein [Treponema sp.]|jgi:transketolase|nr:transketolase family protein [Treponema sp.]
MPEKIATRHAYGEALAELGGADSRIVVLDADVSTCTMSCIFGEKYPDRFYNVGIAEANMVGLAAGMATTGLIPFVHSFAMFTAGRTFDQIRNSLAYPNLNVKVVGTHAGLTVGEDGATHQCLEDLGIMRAIPNMVVVCPCDGNETRAAVSAIAEYTGPVYLRLGRLAMETVTGASDYRFRLGKSVTLCEGTDAAIIATGMMVQAAVGAAQILSQEGIHVRVLDVHTIKPLDADAVLKAARETGALVTAEEHNVLCGLGGAVAELVSGAAPVPVIRVGTEDTFGKSGNAEQLVVKFGLTKENIAAQVKKAIGLKK